MDYKWHNPEIAIILSNGTKEFRFLENEILINRVHFIWLGSEMIYQKSKNIPKFIEVNQNCEYDFYLWYDSILLNERQIEATYKFIDSLNKHEKELRIYLCDMRQYSLFDDDFILDSYEYEIGVKPRPGINPLASEIKNYGMSSDVLRMCILKLYGGFYMDLDMTPINLCEYHKKDRIKSCPLRFCIALSNKPNYMLEDYPEVYHNIYENYDEYYNYRDIYGDEKFDDEWYMEYIYENEGFVSGLINNGLYYDPGSDYHGYINLYFSIFKRNYEKIMKHRYYGYFLDYMRTTVRTSGPGVFVELFTEKTPDYLELSSYKAILRDIIEDQEQSTHSWVTIAKYRDILAILLYELFKDAESVELTYQFLNRYGDQNVTIEDKISGILKTYLYIFNKQASTMYNTTPTYKIIINTLIQRILSNDQPSIGLYIDLAETFVNIPGPYIMNGVKGNYTIQEQAQTEFKFRTFMNSFIIKYNFV
jgi:hypothetical protein